ncbi:hypothetical protein AGDE_08630 [Angomonas deanei]|uniref:Uncharacterized protein n=1 Tax=Angomonas deanei TaxID=59799 RepID=A0A7G2C8W9_9TRYP|nr:hypothetical protein AGDE_08630 [Angomonas deanei]CAD2215287.1 hypothetical protein, conserved [Angomonas deanei]|eukprot:EPY32503.1 hypothetical protein AGDE_08630 [Angomonas deanei]
METSERQSLGDQHPLSAFEKLSDLRKLSLSECGLHSLPQRWFLPYITELRLANNSLPSMQPEGVILRSIKILDVSNNKINDVSTLRRCKFVKQIAIKGNPLTAQHDGNGLYNLYRTVANLFEHLESVDGHPISDLLRSSKEEGSTAVKAPSAPLEEKDVVVDLPVVETVNQTSVVKRHRSLSDAPSTKAVVSGGDAISLLKKRKESSSW